MSEDEGFASLFEAFEKGKGGSDKRQPKVGEMVTGRVVSIGNESVFVDLGTKTEGIIEIEELTDQEGHLTVAVGDQVSIAVGGIDPESGTLLLGSRHARPVHGIDGLRQAQQQQQPVEGFVTGMTKGGLEVEVSGIRAFCPASQVDLGFVEELEAFVGQRLTFRITKLETGRHPNLVLSRKVLLEEEQRALAVETRSRLEVGAVMKGRVSALKEFGAFIDLGGVEGMVHVSELSFGRITHPKDLLHVDQQVEVVVLRIEQRDNGKERIALSLKALEKDPWEDIQTRISTGSRLSGVISRIQPFGAFVELYPGIDGLVHISELGAGNRVAHPKEVVNLGDRVEALVLSIDPEKRRISLSLDPQKRAGGNEETPASTSSSHQEKPSFGTLGDLFGDRLKKPDR